MHTMPAQGLLSVALLCDHDHDMGTNLLEIFSPVTGSVCKLTLSAMVSSS
jgi:hypothetical protein